MNNNPSDVLRANFTISADGKRAIEAVRVEYDARFPDDPAAVACIGWSLVTSDDGTQSESVFVAYYQRSMYHQVAHGIQVVSGVKLIFFTTEEYAMKFEGKVLDYANGRGFFLRGP